MEIKVKAEQPIDRLIKHLTVKEIMYNNFVGGLFWALGATVGLSIIFTVLTLIAKQVNLIPIVGTFVSNIITFVLTKNPNL